MKSFLIAATAATVIAFSGTASASEALAQKNGCTKCHDVEKKKKGPSFKASAAKFKGKEAELTKQWKEDHEDVKISDDDLGALLKWVLSL